EATSVERTDEAAEEASEAQADAVVKETLEAVAEGEEQVSREVEDDIEANIVDIDEEGVASELAAELAERTDDLQRLNSEYTNYRRRTERDRQAVIENAKSQVIAAFLPI